MKKVGKVPIFLEFTFYWEKSDPNVRILNNDGEKCFGKILLVFTIAALAAQQMFLMNH